MKVNEQQLEFFRASTIEMVPRHFSLHIDANIDGTAAMELLQIIAAWDDDAAGGLVGAVRVALVEANGGKELELPQTVVIPDQLDGEPGGGVAVTP